MACMWLWGRRALAGMREAERAERENALLSINERRGVKVNKAF